MRRIHRNTLLIAIAAGVLFGSNAFAAEFAGKPALTRDQFKSRRVISHPRGWSLADGGANWFSNRSMRNEMRQAFAEHSAIALPRAVEQRLVADCADLAYVNLHSFAVANGLRLGMKVYVPVQEPDPRNPSRTRTRYRPRYVDSADFATSEDFISFVRNKMGALHAIDNQSVVLPASKLTEPSKLQIIQPGDNLMWVHVPQQLGRAVRYGHTAPITGVEIGPDLDSSVFKIVYGNVDINSATDYAVVASQKRVNDVYGQRVKANSFSFGDVYTVLAPWSGYEKLQRGNLDPQKQQGAMGWSLLVDGI